MRGDIETGSHSMELVNAGSKLLMFGGKDNGAFKVSKFVYDFQEDYGFYKIGKNMTNPRSKFVAIPLSLN